MSHCRPGGLAVEPLQPTLQQNRALQCSTREALRPAPDVELYSSTALHSSTALQRSTLYLHPLHAPSVGKLNFAWGSILWLAAVTVWVGSISGQLVGGSSGRINCCIQRGTDSVEGRGYRLGRVRAGSIAVNRILNLKIETRPEACLSRRVSQVAWVPLGRSHST